MTAHALALVFGFLFGAAIGSFLNVVIYRVPRGQSIVSPPSHCPSCDARIAWYENLPIVSYLVLRGRCAHCGAHIDLRYPVIELLGGVLGLACVAFFGATPLAVRSFVFVSFLVTLTYIDLEHWLLPHAITWPGIVVGLATAWIPGAPGLLACLIGAAAGFLGLWIVGVVARRALGQDALGGGDPFLLALIGAFLGWMPLGPVVFLASVQGMVGFVVMAVTRRGHDTTEAPGEATSEDAGASTEERDEAAEEMGAPADETGEPAAADADEEWIPPPNAVPFGPFLSLGALEMAFAGTLVMGFVFRLLGLQ